MAIPRRQPFGTPSSRRCRCHEAPWPRPPFGGALVVLPPHPALAARLSGISVKMLRGYSIAPDGTRHEIAFRGEPCWRCRRLVGRGLICRYCLGHLCEPCWETHVPICGVEVLTVPEL